MTDALTGSSAPVKGQTIAGIERALDVLIYFDEAAGATLGVTEIAEGLGLSKAVVHRILSSYRVKGFIEFDPHSRRYRLGAKIVSIGLGYLARIDVRALARPALSWLCEATNETATLSIRSGWSRVYIDQVTPLRDVKMMVQLGSSFPLHAGASSKAILAFLEQGEREEYLDRMPMRKLTENTITDGVALRRELDRIVERGYAVSFGERDPSAGSVAAPVFGLDQLPQAVMSVAGPLERFRSEAERFTGLLLKATDGISAQLGGRSPSTGPGPRS